MKSHDGLSRRLRPNYGGLVNFFSFYQIHDSSCFERETKLYYGDEKSVSYCCMVTFVMVRTSGGRVQLQDG